MFYIPTHSNRAQAKDITRSTGCKRSYALMRLAYYNRIDQTVPDAMHTVKHCTEKLLYLITGIVRVCMCVIIHTLISAMP